MPVHLAFDRHRGALDPAVLLVERELDRLLDSKGCSRQSVFRRLEVPVCSCERCYSFLANPVVAKLLADDGPWSSEELLAGQWFSLCPWAACDCEKDCRRVYDAAVNERSEVISDESPPLLKKRMTSEKSSIDGDAFVTGSRRPLVDLQRGVSPRPPSDALKRPDAFHPAHGVWPGGWPGDEARSWVQPPPNRTICHIVDDATLERLTAASSPVLTRCCVTSAAAARKQGTSRNVGGKAKAKNQCVSR